MEYYIFRSEHITVYLCETGWSGVGLIAYLSESVRRMTDKGYDWSITQIA